jgi:hypothetical protein
MTRLGCKQESEQLSNEASDQSSGDQGIVSVARIGTRTLSHYE